MSKEPKVSLCVITGNEETHVRRFLESFGPAFDELCMVRAIGNQRPDNTLTLAQEWCRKHGKACLLADYFNHGSANHGEDYDDSFHKQEMALPLDENNPASWPHVDDFGAARNLSWFMGTGDWKLWADLDDILMPGSAEIIRLASNDPTHDLFYFAYHIPQGSGQDRNMRERMYRTGISSWHGPIHENCHPFPNTKARACFEEKVVFSHEPKHDKQRDPERNGRIMRYHSRFLWMFFELFRESYYKWCATGDKKDENEALKWAELADKTELHPEMRAQMLLYLAHMHSKKDLPLALEQAWGAVRIAPMLRDGWAWLAELELMGPSPGRARMFTTFMQSMPKPSGATGIPRSLRWHGENGLLLRTRSLRADGDEAGARKAEKTVFEAHGRRFSLLHATRGRPQKALETRANFLAAALNPLCIEHIFAIDADDTASIEALKWYRHVIVKEPHGCVKAWNAAAAESSGQVLVQLSDDWMPCQHWDEFMWLMFAEAAQKKEKPVEEVPLVLAISDGHRKDGLLCMAICTRARYINQVERKQVFPTGGIAAALNMGPNDEAYYTGTPYLFAPEYFGVYSDNEFSVRAYDDGIVLDGRHIIMEHRHALFKGVKPEDWDETYKRQNHPDRYAEGKAIFNRRNPNFVIP